MYVDQHDFLLKLFTVLELATLPFLLMMYLNLDYKYLDVIYSLQRFLKPYYLRSFRRFKREPLFLNKI